jgi:TolA-binding protein
MLDFGTEAPPPPSPDLSERIRKVKEKIEEINQRIQRLTAQRD